MSNTVKVFIVLNLLLAAYFVFAEMTLYATRENWKRRWNDDTTLLSQEIKQGADKLAQESYNRVRAEMRISSYGTQVNEQQVEIKRLEEDKIQQQKKDIPAKELTISKNDEEIKALREQNQTLSNTLELTRQSNSEHERIAAVARAVAFQLNVKLAAVEDDYNNSVQELSQREETIAGLTKDSNQLKAQMSILKSRYPKTYSEVTEGNPAATFLHAIVGSVKVNPQGKQDLVILTIGKGDKVEEGVDFIIFRGNQYIVKVRAESVYSDMVACRVIPDSWGPNHLQVQVGDLAQNRIF